MKLSTRLSNAVSALLGKSMQLTAALFSVDEDEGWRALGRNPGASQWANINQLNYRDMLKAAHFLAQRNPLAKRITQLFSDMTIGDGVQYQVGKNATPALKDFVDEWWRSNDMENRLGRLGEAVSRTGERVIPAQEDEITGMVRLGFIDPEHVTSVRYIPGTDMPEKLIRVGAPGETEEARTLRVIHEEHDPDTGEVSLQGDVFWWAINRSEGQERGYSDLLATADWLDTLDEFMFASLDRARIANSVVWDVTLNGKSEDEIAQFARKNGTPPAPNSVRFHNENVTWDPKAPELGAFEAHREQRTIKEHIVGNYGFALSWFGSGEDANLATANTMQMPALKMLRARRRYLFNELEKMITFAVQRAAAKGKLSPQDAASMELTLQAPELEDSKIGAVAAAIQQLVASLALAVQNGWISTDVAKRGLAMLFSEVGIEYDPEDDEKALEDEQADKQKQAEEELDRMLAKARVDRDQGSDEPPDPPGSSKDSGKPVPPNTPREN